jgi:peptide/nickel transport system ATP-binding protein
MVCWQASAACLAASAEGGMTDHLLEVTELVLRYPVRKGQLEAVSGVTFAIDRGETLGLVGESGCGKSSTGRAVLQLPPPTAGTVRLDGRDLAGLGRKELKAMRRRMQLISQDPVAALNPRRRARDIVAEGLVIAGARAAAVKTQVAEAFRLVGMDIAVVGDRRPHELSGGQCQRLAIARALVLRPELLVCDEPVASLDMSIQGQVLNLLEDMRRELGLSMLFISHDLTAVRNVSDRVAVMYLGRFAEVGDADAIIKRPAHPYTRALLSAVPVADARAVSTEENLEGELPSPLSPPSGCRFRTRCPLAQERCAQETPKLRPVADRQEVACHFPLHGPVAPHGGDLVMAEGRS